MTKLSKFLKYLAVSAFLLALAVNVKVSLSDPFVTMSEEAIAQTTSDISYDISCAVICTPGGNGLEGYYLLEAICPEFILILRYSAYCTQTNNCDDVCMYADEHDCTEN